MLIIYYAASIILIELSGALSN